MRDPFLLVLEFLGPRHVRSPEGAIARIRGSRGPSMHWHFARGRPSRALTSVHYREWYALFVCGLAVYFRRYRRPLRPGGHDRKNRDNALHRQGVYRAAGIRICHEQAAEPSIGRPKRGLWRVGEALEVVIIRSLVSHCAGRRYGGEASRSGIAPSCLGRRYCVT